MCPFVAWAPPYFEILFRTALFDIISPGRRHGALYGSNYGIICINYDLISVLVSKGKHADLEYERICHIAVLYFGNNWGKKDKKMITEIQISMTEFI